MRVCFWFIGVVLIWISCCSFWVLICRWYGVWCMIWCCWILLFFWYWLLEWWKCVVLVDGLLLCWMVLGVVWSGLWVGCFCFWLVVGSVCCRCLVCLVVGLWRVFGKSFWNWCIVELSCFFDWFLCEWWRRLIILGVVWWCGFVVFWIFMCFVWIVFIFYCIVL